MAASFGIPMAAMPAQSAAVLLGGGALKVFDPPDALGEPIVTLHQCKHVDRTTKRMQCTAQLHLRPHKRGYLAVACDCGHQWVWCSHCCDCSLGTRGCIMPAHWMERDSFDTGKRNHMQRHSAQPDNGSTAGTSGAGKPRTPDGRPMLKVKELPAPIKKIMLAPGIGMQPFLGGTQAVPGMESLPQLLVSAAGGSAVGGLTAMPNGAPIVQVANVPVAVPNMNSSLYVTPKTAMLYVSPGASNSAQNTLWTDGSVALFSKGLQILQRCKHVDRKRNRMPCPCRLRTRNHKRGYLAIVCEAGHQWVWCSYCCDCARPQVGCSNPNHWMERDSFDTGRRNHMQRHLENYDANEDEGGQLMAMMAPRQVAMPKLVIQSQTGPLVGADALRKGSCAARDRPIKDGSGDGQGKEGGRRGEDESGSSSGSDDGESSQYIEGDDHGKGGQGRKMDVGLQAGKHKAREEQYESDAGSGTKRKREQHPLFNDELAELAATALMALAQNRKP